MSRLTFAKKCNFFVSLTAICIFRPDLMSTFTPKPRHKTDEKELRISSAAAFQTNVIVLSTRKQVWSLVEMMRREERKALIDLSNEKFKACVSFCLETSNETEVSDRIKFQEFCGSVIAFYCVRFVLFQTPIPLAYTN